MSPIQRQLASANDLQELLYTPRGSTRSTKSTAKPTRYFCHASLHLGYATCAMIAKVRNISLWRAKANANVCFLRTIVVAVLPELVSASKAISGQQDAIL